MQHQPKPYLCRKGWHIWKKTNARPVDIPVVLRHDCIRCSMRKTGTYEYPPRHIPWRKRVNIKRGFSRFFDMLSFLGIILLAVVPGFVFGVCWVLDGFFGAPDEAFPEEYRGM